MDERISNFDIPGLLSGIAPSWASKAACAVLGIGLAVVLRLITDRIIPGAAPFAFVYPAALAATLLGGWQAGLGTLAGTEFLAWKFVVPMAAGGHSPQQVTGAILVAITAAAVIAVGEAFRIAARNSVAERGAKLAERELLFRELQHRVSNDFTIVNSLLEMQRKRSTDPETRQALAETIARIQSVAKVHHHLYIVPDIGAIDFRKYLADLCAALAEAALPPVGLSLRCYSDEAYMPRNRAIAVGLVTNELMTNAIKHAFPGGREGSIDVRFERSPQGWQLSVKDDGVGVNTARAGTGSGLGTGLVEEFARQAGGTLAFESGPGTLARLDLPASAAAATPAQAANLA